jgi:O-antigen ligase
MIIGKESIKRCNLAVAFFTAFAGYYVVLLVIINLGMRSETRSLTIPLRLLIVFCFAFAFLLKPRIKYKNGLFFFLLFSFLYYCRIAFEALQGNSSFHISVVSFFLYFTSFVFLPILLVSQLRLDRRDYNFLFYAVIIGCFLMGLDTFFYYQDLLGSVRRISTNVSSSNISPLALSYTSALGIGVSISYLLTNKIGDSRKWFLYVTIAVCLIPFFLGASRGSVVALFIPFIFYFIFGKGGIKRKISVITVLIGLCILFSITAQYLGFGVFDRFFSIGHRIESGTANRLYFWQDAWYQFLQNPWLGNSLEANRIGYYPHNILLEALITTGFFGFLCYTVFLIFVLKKSIYIMKEKPSHFFIVVIFIQALTQGMFSGGIYNTSWLAIGAGLILGYDKTDK